MMSNNTFKLILKNNFILPTSISLYLHDVLIVQLDIICMVEQYLVVYYF